MTEERMPRKEFEAACDVKHDDFAEFAREWMKAMNGPLPAVKVTPVFVPRVVSDSRRPAPKDFPVDWSVSA